jgi:hypothetical protein
MQDKQLWVFILILQPHERYLSLLKQRRKPSNLKLAMPVHKQLFHLCRISCLVIKSICTPIPIPLFIASSPILMMHLFKPHPSPHRHCTTDAPAPD